MTEPIKENNEQQDNEIFQLRDIIFGESKRELELRVNQMEKEFTERLTALEKQIMKKIQQAQSQLDASINKLESMMQAIDKSHIEREQSIDDHLSATQSELEAFSTASRQESQDIIKQIQTQATLLTDEFSKKYEEAMNQLKTVSDNLETNKTDKVALANLLREVAINLEQDTE